MKIVVIGGTGLIATKLVNKLRQAGHELVRRFLGAMKDARQVVADAHVRYFGAELDDKSLTPGDSPRVGGTRFAEWLGRVAQGGTLKPA